MKHVPSTTESPVLRTDFSDQAAFEALRAEIRSLSPDGFQAYVDFIDDPAFNGISKEQLLAAISPDYPHSFIIVADSETITHAEHPLLVVSLQDDGMGAARGDAFRALPATIQGIQNNLSIANMDFVDFSGAVDKRGVFRGF
jgi:hypothetical protein